MLYSTLGCAAKVEYMTRKEEIRTFFEEYPAFVKGLENSDQKYIIDELRIEGDIS